MSFNNKSQSFCSKYLSKVSGIQSKTIAVMIDNGFDSVHSLLAIEVDTDIQQIPDILLGQKAVLREAIRDLQKYYKQLGLESKDNSFAKLLLEESLVEDNSSPLKTSRQISVDSGSDSSDTSPPKTPSVDSSQKTSDKSPEKTLNDRSKKKSTPLIVDRRLSTDNSMPQSVAEKFGLRSASKSKTKTKNGSKGNRKGDHISHNASLVKQYVGFVDSALDINEDEEPFDDYIESTEFVSSTQPDINLTPLKIPKPSKNIKQSRSKGKVCLVCGDTSKGINHGVPSCKGCGIFFKRVVSGQVVTGECSDDNNCPIDPKNRHKCRPCRYEACVRAGMAVSRGKPSHSQEEEEAVEEQPQKNEEMEGLRAEQLSDSDCEMSATPAFDYTTIECGRSPKSPKNVNKRQLKQF